MATCAVCCIITFYFIQIFNSVGQLVEHSDCITKILDSRKTQKYEYLSFNFIEMHVKCALNVCLT